MYQQTRYKKTVLSEACLLMEGRVILLTLIKVMLSNLDLNLDRHIWLVTTRLDSIDLYKEK